MGLLFSSLEIRVLKTMLIVRPLSFMKVVHIKLPDERGEIVVLKESW